MGRGVDVAEKEQVNHVPPPVVIDPTRQPIVVVDDLHIKYKVYGTVKEKGTGASALGRLLRGRSRPQMTEIHAVRGVSFVAYKGDAIGVIGTNGSGKSTLLKAVAGLLPPATGGVFTDGQPSLLGVGAALMKDLTGERNIILGCLAMGLTPDETKEKYQEIVQFAGLRKGFIKYPMNTYSSGMGARLRFAIASARTHDVLLIDEALATGDAKFRRRSKRKIEELRKNAGAVFLVAHQLDVVAETCNRVLWLDDGQLVMDGTPEEVIAAYTEAINK
ncbi:teichoic acid transport system ATP-binding protein [Actinocorallia herbida]|uniref:Teichoic acid transport system ATP-binding protein n=1 Tax=Actinocorallia herbida TaxID=58109 RepID=A0A3N1DCR9_9ACTN|nr:teichoic acid transport system ATP-binding protein [Actinocorallia herbida]